MNFFWKCVCQLWTIKLNCFQCCLFLNWLTEWTNDNKFIHVPNGTQWLKALCVPTSYCVTFFFLSLFFVLFFYFFFFLSIFFFLFKFFFTKLCFTTVCSDVCYMWLGVYGVSCTQKLQHEWMTNTITINGNKKPRRAQKKKKKQTHSHSHFEQSSSPFKRSLKTIKELNERRWDRRTQVRQKQQNLCDYDDDDHKCSSHFFSPFLICVCVCCLSMLLCLKNRWYDLTFKCETNASVIFHFADNILW